MGTACEVRFTRYYDAAPDDVWAALTEPHSLARWLARPGAIDLSPGGPFELRLQSDETLEARVRAVEPARLLELDWAPPGEEPSIVRFELNRDGDGTVLVLDHRRIDARIGMRYMARWWPHLERLDSVVERRSVPS
jgi:uncharacterized protein YndB with AHSA1/START domain